ncbi:hypothetical protein [uncultured Micrococcus sp.]|uniref:hypothetical protein n=1 Tax=uncultured Micrococcus sp. TaxID=114051 RepID=UPI0026366AB6|nr:hypothetical protein [uncultured Micrococcus sp.]
MTHPQTEERRPLTLGTALNTKTESDTTKTPISPSIVPDSADLVAGVFVLVVTVPGDPEPRHRRRVFLQAQPAQKAADRAVARGHHAEVVLCRLVPEVYGGEASA